MLHETVEYKIYLFIIRRYAPERFYFQKSFFNRSVIELEYIELMYNQRNIIFH